MVLNQRFSWKSTNWLQWLVLLLGGLLLLDLVTFLIAEGLWFQAVGYVQVFAVRLRSQAGLGLFAFAISMGFLLFNLKLANRHLWRRDLKEYEIPPLPGQMGLTGLLPLTTLLSLMMGVMLFYHGQIAISHWHPNLSLYDVSTQAPIKFHPTVLWQIAQQLIAQPWYLGGLVAIAIALLIYPHFLLQAIALLMSLGFGLVISENWANVLLYFYPTTFDRVDPLFNQNVSFYIFRLPFLELLNFWLVGLSVFAFLSVSLTYLLSGNSLSQGKFSGFRSSQQHHLYFLGGCLFLAIALSYWIDRYELLYSPSGVVYGASYTNVTIELPANILMSITSGIIGLVFMGRSILGVRGQGSGVRDQGAGIRGQGSRVRGQGSRVRRQASGVRRQGSGIRDQGSGIREVLSFKLNQTSNLKPQTSNLKPQTSNLPTPYSLPPTPYSLPPTPYPLPPLLLLLTLYLATAAIASFILPLAVQRLIVQPNELQLETPYLQHAIALTREAFELDKIEEETFDPKGNLTYAKLQENELTVKNIRLWDTRPLLETNRQLQRIRPYYEFPGADIDRYTIQTDTGESEQRQVLIAARELDYNSVPAEAQTWVNEHLIYTHGYGFTLSPVNTAGEGGLPDYFIRGIEMSVSSPSIRNSIPIENPRIYYGELTNTYIMTPTPVNELDYPSGSDNVYNTYDGRGGVPIGRFWQRLIFAKHLKDWRMLLTEDFTPQTRLLFRRNIMSRVRAIAPFLRYDADPYLVVANAEMQGAGVRDQGSGIRDSPTETLREQGSASQQLTANSQQLTANSQQPIANSQQLTANAPNHLYWIIDAYTTSDRYPYSDPLQNNFNYIRNSVKIVVDAYNGSVVFYVADDTDPIINTWSHIFPGMFKPLSNMLQPLQVHIRYPQDFFRVQSDHLMIYHMTDPQVFYNREDQWRAPNEIYADEPQLVAPYYLIMKLPAEDKEEFILLRPFAPNQRTNLIAWLAARSDRIYPIFSRAKQTGKMLLYRFPKQELVFGPEQVEARINQDPIISQRISLWNRRGSSAVQGNLLVIPIDQSLLYVEPLYLEASINQLPTLARVITANRDRIVMAETLEDSLKALFQTSTTPDTSTIIRDLEGELLLEQ
jgi:uncharacterized membrane protein (UPF0182 family)